MAASDVSIRFAAEGDASLKSAVQAIDAQMRALNEQLKASTEGMKDLSTAEDASAKRTEALTGIIAGNQEKLRLLGEQYDQAKAKLDQLGEAMRKAQQSGDPAAIDKATTAYNRQSVEVSRLEGAMSKAEGEIAKAGNAMTGAGTETTGFQGKIEQLASTMSIQLASEAIGKVVDAMERMGRAVIDAGKAVWDMASESSTFADDLLTQATQTGISTTALQEYAYAARFVDTEVSTVTGALQKLTRSMSSGSKETAAAFSSLGISVTDSSGQMRDAQEVFWQAIDALGKVENATQRDQLAMQIFGKSAQDLNPLIKAGSDTWRKYADEAHNAGLILSEDSVGALGEFNDGLQRIDATMEAAQRQIMGALAPAFSEIAKYISEAAQEFTKWVQTDEAKQYLAEITELIKGVASGLLQNLKPAVETGIEIFKSIGGAIQFLSENFDIIVAAIQTFITVWATLKVAMAGLQIAALLTNPIGQAVLAVGALTAAITLLVTHWEEVKEAGVLCWEAIKKAWNGAGEWFKSKGQQIYDALYSVSPGLAGMFQTTWSTIQAVWNNSVAFFKAIWESIKGIFSVVKSVLSGDFEGAWNGIKGIVGAWQGYFSTVWSGIKNVFSGVAQTFTGFFQTAWSGIQGIWNAVTGWFGSVVSGIVQAFTSIPQKIGQFFTNAWQTVQRAWQAATQWFTQIGSSIVQAFTSIPTQIGQFFSSAWQTVQRAWQSATQWFSQIGSSIVQTFTSIPSKIGQFFTSAWQTVQRAWQSATSWFSQIGSGVIQAFTSIPSRIGQVFSSAWQSVQRAWGSVTSFFSGIGSSIVQTISSAISSLPGKALGWARDMMEGFGRGIRQFMDTVTRPIKDLASKIAGFLHFSRPDYGPLRDYEQWMPDFVGGLAKTLTASQPILDRAVANLAGGIESQAKGITLSASQTAQAQAPIVMQVDGKTFARLMTPYVDSQQGQTWGTSMRLGVANA